MRILIGGPTKFMSGPLWDAHIHCLENQEGVEVSFKHYRDDGTRSEMTQLLHCHNMKQNKDSKRTICKENNEGMKHKQKHTTNDKLSYKLR